MSFVKIKNWLRNKRAEIYTALLRRDFGRIGKDSVIYPHLHTNDPSEIYLGDGVQIWNGSWLDTFKKYQGIEYQPRLEIGDGTYIGRNAHICACTQVTIGKNVVFADSVYVSDLLHGFEDVNTPVMDQPLVCPGPVVIEDDVWLGERVCVMPNVTIGKHSVIGSNSVVTKDIPPYSVAVGSPAKIIKQYNSDTKKWEKV
jgi:acetyltransferase-like isoleucine patch superfamily enzyme